MEYDKETVEREKKSGNAKKFFQRLIFFVVLHRGNTSLLT